MGLGYRVACRRYVFGAVAPLFAFGFQFAGAVHWGPPCLLFTKGCESHTQKGWIAACLSELPPASPSFPPAFFIPDVHSWTINCELSLAWFMWAVR